MSVGYYIAHVQEPDTCPECHKRPVYRGGICKHCYEYVSKTFPGFLNSVSSIFQKRAELCEKQSCVTYIYAIQGLDLVKIGISKAPEKRCSDMQVGSPVLLNLLGQIEGSEIIEKCIHIYLQDYQSHGEWFRYEGLVRNFVEAICNKDFDRLESLLEV